MDGRSEVPESKGNVGDAVEVEEIVACRCAEYMGRWVGNFRALVCGGKRLVNARSRSHPKTLTFRYPVHRPAFVGSPYCC